MTDLNERWKRILARRDEIRYEQEVEQQWEIEDQEGHADIVKVDACFNRDMSGQTFRDSYGSHSASALRKRAAIASNGHAKDTLIPPPGPARWGSD